LNTFKTQDVIKTNNRLKTLNGKKVKFSIITVSYNSANSIAKTIESVLSQEDVAVEYILIDGYSKDGTQTIIEKYISKISIFVSETDYGIYDAMNKGLSFATGDIIGILNSDDVYIDKFVLKDIYETFQANPNIDGVYADLQYTNPRNNNKIVRHWVAGEFSPSNFYKGWMPPHPTVFLKNAVYQRAGLFNLNLKSAADYEFLLRACLVHGTKLFYLPRTIVNMSIGGQSNASILNRLRANQEDRLAWKINNLRGGYLASILKPLRKIFQFTLK
jgi:glycosyltransferase